MPPPPVSHDRRPPVTSRPLHLRSCSSGGRRASSGFMSCSRNHDPHFPPLVSPRCLPHAPGQRPRSRKQSAARTTGRLPANWTRPCRSAPRQGQPRAASGENNSGWHETPVDLRRRRAVLTCAPAALPESDRRHLEATPARRSRQQFHGHRRGPAFHPVHRQLHSRVGFPSRACSGLSSTIVSKIPGLQPGQGRRRRFGSVGDPSRRRIRATAKSLVGARKSAAWIICENHHLNHPFKTPPKLSA